MIQNHLLQVVSYLAMEAPSSTYAEAIRDEQAKVLRNGAAARSPSDMVRGQFRGYRDEPGVAQDSQVPTYAALRLHVDSWRWEGVPFFVRAGKCLREDRAPRSCVELQAARRRWCSRSRAAAMGNYVRFRLSPQVAIAIGARAKRPGEGMDGRAGRAVGRCAQDAGERHGRLRAAARRRDGGDATLFARQDVVEAAWAIVDPVIHGPSQRRSSTSPAAGGRRKRTPGRRHRRLEHAVFS